MQVLEGVERDHHIDAGVVDRQRGATLDQHRAMWDPGRVQSSRRLFEHARLNVDQDVFARLAAPERGVANVAGPDLEHAFAVEVDLRHDPVACVVDARADAGALVGRIERQVRALPLLPARIVAAYAEPPTLAIAPQRNAQDPRQPIAYHAASAALRG